jgi:hypothetical protein
VSNTNRGIDALLWSIQRNHGLDIAGKRRLSQVQGVVASYAEFSISPIVSKAYGNMARG